MSVTLTDLMSTPVSEIDPERERIPNAVYEVRLADVNVRYHNDDPNQGVHRYGCFIKIVSGDFAGRQFWFDIYPEKKDGGVNPVGAKQVVGIIKGAYGNMESVAGRQDIGEVLKEIAANDPPLTFEHAVKFRKEWNGKAQYELAV